MLYSQAFGFVVFDEKQPRRGMGFGGGGGREVSSEEKLKLLSPIMSLTAAQKLLTALMNSVLCKAHFCLETPIL